jgi:hypothetical protein
MNKKARLSQLKAGLDQAAKTPAPGEASAGPAIRKTEKSVTPGGLLRRTVYFTEREWSALMTESFSSGISASQILRQLVRQRFDLD